MFPAAFRTSAFLMCKNKAISNNLNIFCLRYSAKQGNNQNIAIKRFLTTETKNTAETAAKETASKTTTEEAKKSLWNSPEFWGTAGAIAGWGMSGAAIYDAMQSSAEIISLKMTGVLLVYSSLFARWAFIVLPPNPLLGACHLTNIVAQGNQMRRALQYKTEQGQGEEVQDFLTKAGAATVAGVASIALAPTIQSFIVSLNLGPISTFAAADAGPFTTHFWAPMSKWLISGASFMELDRPTEKISLAQYTALTLTGFFFTRYSLLVIPVNYVLCSVNVALFGSSAWHLGRKIKADFIDDKKKD